MKKIFFLIFVLIFLFLSTVHAQTWSCDPGANPLTCLGIVKTTSGYGDATIEQILLNIINAALSLLFLVVLGFLIYGGYYWMTSMGNEERVKKATQILRAAVIGLIIVLASLSIVNFVADAIGAKRPDIPEDTGLFIGKLDVFLSNIINAALTLVGAIALGVIVYGGFRWMTSAGNEETVSESKRVLTAGVIGLIIIIISWAIVNFIVSRLGAVG